MNALILRIATVFALLAVAALPQTNVSARVLDEASVEELNFRVLLDDRQIGFHRFKLADEGEARFVESRAEFDVKFLFITAYRYRHSNREQWSGTCLAALDAETDANGKRVEVSGERTTDSFIVTNGSVVEELPSCVMSFAYWDPRILEQPRLLNTQTGELVEVTVEGGVSETLSVRGREIAAERYRLLADELQIDVWYSPDGEWLALESPAKGGRTLRYELT